MDYKTQIIENAKNIAKILSDALKIKELPESTQGIKSDDSIALQRGDETLQAKISELPFASITDIYGLTALIKGGYYNILGTYNYFVWVQEYIINGTYTNFYRSNTLPVETSDLTFDRFDTIIINTAGLLFIRKGVASANPIEPEVDNLTELKIALIFVEANSVAPVGVTEVVVFDEGGGTASGEFDITHAGSVLSAEQSSSGANSLKLVNKSAAFAISTLNYNGSELSNITMKVFLATSTKNALRFSLWNVDDMRVGEVYVNHNDYGFNAYLIGVWQTLSIPSTGFRTADWAALQYNTLWINNNKSGSTVYIDDIKIQQGLSQPTNSNITHTHSNFSLLESITQTLVNSWSAAYNWVNTNGANVLENLANKKTDVEANKTSDTFYPSIKSIVDWVTSFFLKGSGTVNYLPKFGVGGKVVGNSIIFDNGTSVGIGTNSPQSRFTISGSLSLGTSQFNILNTEGGNFIWKSGISGISNNGASFMTANVDGSNEVLRMVITSPGNLGISTSSPSEKVHAVGNGKFTGSVQVGDNTSVASASNVGAQRYRVSGNNSYVDVCMQTGASTYAWVNTMTQSW